MELVSSSCFLSLSTQERWQQIYLALGGTDDCLAGGTILEAQQAILALLGSEECIHTPEDFWRAWAAFLGIECVESSMDAQRHIYGYYGGDESCFDGLGPDGQALGLFSILSGGSFPGYFYVSSSEGSDENSGFSEALPMATIGAAIAAAEAQSNPVLGIRVRGGDTFYEAVTWPSTLSGTEDEPFEFTTYGTGKATISGGALVTGWTLHDAARNIWVATHDEATGIPRHITCNGVRCSRPQTAIPPGCTVSGNTIDTSASVEPGFGSAWTDKTDIEIVFRMYWQEQRIPVESITGNTITLDAAAMEALDYIYSVVNILTPTGALFAVENNYAIFEQASSTRTFNFKRSTNQIFLIPPVGVSDPNDVDVIVPVIETALTADGVSDLIVSGIRFTDTAFNRPLSEGGFAEIQAGLCVDVDEPFDPEPWSYTVPTTAVRLLGCARLRVQGCEFLRTGSGAVLIDGDASEDVEIVGNVFDLLGGSGVVNGNANNHAGGPTGTHIHNNIVRRGGLDQSGAVAVLHLYGADTLIEYNHVYEWAYTGISVGLGWGDPITLPNSNTNVVVRLNLVNRCMTEMVDGAGIYSNSAMTAGLIEDNYVYDIGNINPDASPGIYMDNGSTSGSTVQGNVMHTILGPHQLKFNAVASNPTTTEGNIAETGKGAVAGTHTLESLANCRTAGAALNAGLQAEYADLETDFPDDLQLNHAGAAGDWTNGMTGEFIADNSSSSVTQVALTRMINSATERDMFQATAGNRPQFIPNAQNGRGIFRFESGDDTVGQLLAYSNFFTAVALVKLNDTADFSLFFGNGDGGSSGWALINYNNEITGLAGGVAFLGDGTPQDASINAITLKRLRDGTWKIRINNVELASTGTPTTPVSPWDFVQLSGICDVLALRVYPYPLPDEQDSVVQNALYSDVFDV